MNALQFASALWELGWTREDAAGALDRLGATNDRVSRWAEGAEPIPQGVANFLRSWAWYHRSLQRAPYN